MTDVTDSEIDGRMASASTAPSETDPLAPSLEATWTPASAITHPTAPLPRALEAKWATVAQQEPNPAPGAKAAASETSDTGASQDRSNRGERSELTLDDTAAPNGGLRRFRRPRTPSAVPDPYPSLRDARACGLFV